MELKIEDDNFKPFNITISVESEYDLRRLWHIFAAADNFVSGTSYQYVSDSEKNLSAWKVIDKKLKSLQPF